MALLAHSKIKREIIEAGWCGGWVCGLIRIPYLLYIQNARDSIASDFGSGIFKQGRIAMDKFMQ